MSIYVTYQSRDYDPAQVTARYVRFDGANFRFCEVANDRGFDIRQGVVNAEDLPADVKVKAIELQHTFPSYVEWPLEGK